MMMCPLGSAKGIAMLLISLGVGYFVCAKADGQKGFLKQLGYWIGTIIIVLSILAAVRGVYFNKCCMKMHGEYMPAKMCPMMHAK